jgi:hypothetical protein
LIVNLNIKKNRTETERITPTKAYFFKRSTFLNFKKSITTHNNTPSKNRSITIKKGSLGMRTGLELLARTMITLRPTKKKTMRTPSLQAMLNR